MKHFFILYCLALLPFISASGQESLTYTEVIETKNTSKAELYKRAKLWFVTTYNSANDVLQMDDNEEGILIGKGIMKYKPNIFYGSDNTRGNIKYTIKVFLRENRYKYEITDFIHDPYGRSSMGLITTDEEPASTKKSGKKWRKKVWNDIKDQIKTYTDSLINNLKDGMAGAAGEKSDDW